MSTLVLKHKIIFHLLCLESRCFSTKADYRIPTYKAFKKNIIFPYFSGTLATVWSRHLRKLLMFLETLFLLDNSSGPVCEVLAGRGGGATLTENLLHNKMPKSSKASPRHFVEN